MDMLHSDDTVPLVSTIPHYIFAQLNLLDYLIYDNLFYG